MISLPKISEEDLLKELLRTLEELQTPVQLVTQKPHHPIQDPHVIYVHPDVLKKYNQFLLSSNNKEKTKIKCECGAEKCNTTHSDWCPKYDNNY